MVDRILYRYLSYEIKIQIYQPNINQL